MEKIGKRSIAELGGADAPDHIAISIDGYPDALFQPRDPAIAGYSSFSA